MADEQQTNRQRRYGRHRQRESGTRSSIPLPDLPPGSKIDIKNIAFLHVCCKQQPHQIVARFPGALTLADVHAALAHYYREPKRYDDELKKEREFNAPGSLASDAMSLPRVGLESLVATVTENHAEKP